MQKIINSLKKNKYLVFFSLMACVAIIIIIYENSRHINIIDNQVPLSNIFTYNEIGNANYFNPKTGKYYADPEFKIEANDNTGFLFQLFEETEGNITLPEGNFLCKTKLVIKGKNTTITGVKGETKIIFSSESFYNYGRGALAECLLSNENHEKEYNEKTAQKINLRNLIFEYKRTTSNSPKTIALFRNVNGLVVDNCEFFADYDNQIDVTNFDLYSGCKNVKIYDSKFINHTKANEGGCIWVRNLTSDYEIKGNNTENVIIEKCFFSKDSGDEVIAVFSSRGNIRNVTVKDCDINDYSNIDDIVLSAYSSGNQYYGTVSDVTFENNRIYSIDFQAFLFMIGMDGRKNEVKNVNIINNTITTGSMNNKQKFIINVGNGNVNNVLVDNNTIIAENLSLSGAIRKAHIVKNNTIIGDLGFGIRGGEAIGNNIDGAKIGIDSPIIASGNTITNCKVGISAVPGQISISNNKITLNESLGSGGIEIKGKTADDIVLDCSKNEIITKDKSQFGFLLHNGNISLVDNNVSGPGDFMYSSRNTTIAYN